MNSPAAQLLKQVQTLSSAGLGTQVPRPEQTPEAILAELTARDGVEAAAIYVAAEGRVSHWTGSEFPDLAGLSPSAFQAAAVSGGFKVYQGFDGEGDVIGALVTRGDAGDVLRQRETVSQHLQAELTQSGYLGAVFALAEPVEAEDTAIAGHVRRISGYSEVIARAYGAEPEWVRAIRLASPLHDIGKISIPNRILYKPGKLTDDEFSETKRHTVEGASILSHGAGAFWTLAAEIAASHHERWDGTGYPASLAGEAIPLGARIVAVADVFDALTTKRIYKPALGIEQSLNIISEGSSRHFDPDLVDAFQRAFSEILDVKTRVTGL